MTRKPPREYEPPPLNVDYEPFDEAKLGRILKAALPGATPDPGMIAVACEQLNAAAVFLDLYQDLRHAPTDVTARAALKAIRTKAAELRDLLPLTDSDGRGGRGDNPRVMRGVSGLLVPTMSRLMAERLRAEADGRGNGPTAADLFGAELPEEALVVLRELLDLVVASADAELTDPEPSRTRREASPVKDFAAKAARVFLELTGRDRVTSSRREQDQEVGGPLVRFLQACCQHVGEEVPLYTLEDWIIDWRRDGDHLSRT